MECKAASVTHEETPRHCQIVCLCVLCSALRLQLHTICSHLRGQSALELGCTETLLKVVWIQCSRLSGVPTSTQTTTTTLISDLTDLHHSRASLFSADKLHLLLTAQCLCIRVNILLVPVVGWLHRLPRSSSLPHHYSLYRHGHSICPASSLPPVLRLVQQLLLSTVVVSLLLTPSSASAPRHARSTPDLLLSSSSSRCGWPSACRCTQGTF